MQINTLIKDIQYQLTLKGGWFNAELSNNLALEIGTRIQEQFRDKKAPTLRLSQMGPRCPCALWYSIHAPEQAESLPPWAEFKYLYGHVIEALAIALAKAAGHEVTGEQDEITVDGIVGHRDCVVDGCIVDVKSTSTLGFRKFKERLLEQSDDFGYLEQLDGYAVGSLGDPLVRVKNKAYILAIDKTLGHMCLYEHRIREEHIRERIAVYKTIVSQTRAPTCECRSIAEGKSGNLKLDVKGSYNPYKYSCNPHIRTFIYATGPVYLTKVVRKPDVIEVDRYGKVVYN